MEDSVLDEYEKDVQKHWDMLAKAHGFDEIRKVMDSWPCWTQYESESSLKTLEDELEQDNEGET